MEAEDEVDDELSEAADTEVIKQFALMLSSRCNRAATFRQCLNKLRNAFDDVRVIFKNYVREKRSSW